MGRGNEEELPPKAGGEEDKDYSAKDMMKEQFPKDAGSQKEVQKQRK